MDRWEEAFAHMEAQYQTEPPAHYVGETRRTTRLMLEHEMRQKGEEIPSSAEMDEIVTRWIESMGGLSAVAQSIDLARHFNELGGAGVIGEGG